MVLINGLSDDRIAISDRGLQYGDGLFETMAFRSGTFEFIDAHLARLIDGCRRLNIAFLHVEELHKELDIVCQRLTDNDAIIKIIITRGSGGRGYLAETGVEPTRIISTHPLPIYPVYYSQAGVKVRLCTHTLSENVALAGIKHLNRLDQVLARNEWHDSDIAEGIMLDNAGNVIEGTMSNVFIIKAGKLLTPLLDKSGVAGVMRDQIKLLAVKLNISVVETKIHLDDFLAADEIFLTNSVIGIWPVSEMDNMLYLAGPITHNIQHALQQAKK
jgi:4-amino-4-deoxychorismate lyase